MAYFVHPSAVIDSGAHIGTGAKIWHFCHVSTGAQIGERCILGQNVYVAERVRLGRNVKVQNNVSIYAGVECAEDVFLGPSMVFTNVVNPRSGVDRRDQFRSTFVDRGATVGANATIVCGVTIGRYAFVGAGAVVTRSVAPYALVVGNPARPVGWMSRAGIRLVLDPQGRAVCPETGEVYRLLNEELVLIDPTTGR